MKIESIGAFVAVAEAGSISAAARRLRLSVSVVSQRLAELERVLGAPLLHRTTRKLSLTDDGAAFLDRARNIMLEIEEARASLAERRGELSGPLRISAPVTFGRMHLGPALYPFLARHPRIEMTLELDDRRIDVASAGFDAVIRNGKIEDSRLMAWVLAPSRRVLVASADYLSREGEPRSIEELSRHRAIAYTNRGVADWRFGTVTVKARLAIGLNNGDLMRDAAIAGLGIAHLPMFIAGPAVKAGLLRIVDVGMEAVPEAIFVAHADGRQSSAKLRAMADHLRAAFGTPPYWEL